MGDAVAAGFSAEVPISVVSLSRFYFVTVSRKKLRGQSYLLVKITRKTSQNKLVESMHYCIHDTHLRKFLSVYSASDSSK